MQAVAVESWRHNKGKDEVEEDEVVAVVDMVEMLRAVFRWRPWSESSAA